MRNIKAKGVTTNLSHLVAHSMRIRSSSSFVRFVLLNEKNIANGIAMKVRSEVNQNHDNEGTVIQKRPKDSIELPKYLIVSIFHARPGGRYVHIRSLLDRRDKGCDEGYCLGYRADRRSKKKFLRHRFGLPPLSSDVYSGR